MAAHLIDATPDAVTLECEDDDEEEGEVQTLEWGGLREVRIVSGPTLTLFLARGLSPRPEGLVPGESIVNINLWMGLVR